MQAKKPWLIRRTWLEVNLQQLKKNFYSLKKIQPMADLLFVLKADAYGHSAIPIAKTLEALPKDSNHHCFGVATIEEGIRLRRAQIKSPIYILSGIQTMDAEIYRCLLNFKLTPVITSIAVLQALAQEAKNAILPMHIHLKFNTGMNRLGINFAEAKTCIQILRSTNKIKPLGLMSHFAEAENPQSVLSQYQSQCFRDIIKLFRIQGISVRFIHMANSAGLRNHLFPEGNLVRVGLHLYGIGWSKVKPIARWAAQIYQTQSVKKGETVGYSALFQAKHNMKIAILGVGYADGYHRALSNRADVLIQGKRCPVVGAISMDLTAVDITHIKSPKPKDYAILLGNDKTETITAEELAKHANTIPWEIMTSISPRVPRVFR